MSTKTKTQQYYSFLNENSYFEALNVLETFSFESFETIFFSSIKTPKRGAFLGYFFSEYLHQSIYFKEICASSRRREWFEQLFMRDDLICPKLYERMAIDAPESLMEAMKRNYVPFLKQQHFNEILKYDRSRQLKDFFAICCKLSISERFLYERATNSSKILFDKPIEEIFSLVGLWLYCYASEVAIKNNSHQLRIESNAMFSMNHFLTYFLRFFDKKAPVEKFDSDQFQNAIIESVSSKPPYYEVFEEWVNWFNFSLSIIDDFCFYDNPTISINNNFEFNKKPDNVEIEKHLFNLKKIRAYDNFEKGDFEEIINNDLELSENQKILLKMISPSIKRDTRNLFDEFTSAIYYNSSKIDIGIALGTIRSFVLLDKLHFNRQSEIGFTKKSNWKEVLKSLTLRKMTPLFNLLPFSKEKVPFSKRINPKFAELIGPKIHEMEQTFNAITLDILSIKWNKYYNRFNSEINLFDYLRFKIGNSYYSFPRITSNINLHKFTTELALKIHCDRDAQKNVNDEMERFIAHLALEKGLSAKSKFEYEFTNRCDELLSGEIDSVLFDRKRVLGIEFKHSNHKSIPSEVSREREVVIESARRQLDKFHRYLKSGQKLINKELGIDKDIELKALPFIGLIVTTNFEFDHERINDKYYKISWKEWIWILENMKEKSTISEIMDLIERNVYWEEIRKI